MPESKKRSSSKNPRGAHKNGPKRPPPINPRAPWKQSWWVLWGFIAVVSEVIFIFLIKGHLVNLSTLQIVVIGVCLPFVAHLLVSSFRTILILTSSR
jgi:hypothetical protein